MTPSPAIRPDGPAPSAADAAIARDAWVLWYERVSYCAVALFAVLQHLSFVADAGPLWRDEVATANTAHMPTWGEYWYYLQWDSFPALWTTILRFLAVDADEFYRLLGFAVGISTLGLVWIGCHRLTKCHPVFTVAVVGCGFNAIYIGDSIRAYGLGMLFACAVILAMAAYVRHPSRAGLTVVFVSALLALHSLYFDFVPVVGALVAAVAVLLWCRQNPVPLAATVGVALATLGVYRPVLARGESFSSLFRYNPFDPAQYLEGVVRTIGIAGTAGGALFWSAAALAVGVAIRTAWRGRSRAVEAPTARLALLCSGALVFIVPGYFGFLRHLSVNAGPRHFLVLIASVCLLSELAIRSVHRGVKVRAGWATLALVCVGIMIGDGRMGGFPRMSNVRDVAAVLGKSAGPADVILVYPWHYGISLRRYLKPSLSFQTLPEIADQRTHRYDLAKAAMIGPDQQAPAQKAAAFAQKALAAGAVVWFVGPRHAANAGEPPPDISPAPDPKYGWNETNYYAAYAQGFWTFIAEHASEVELVLKPSTGTNPQENMPVFRIRGWRG
ncbi:hypothetical protein CfE428DRAFT_2534 [Chthoniobacter flavus Ellin428]|uniref:Glycosyltransferase RgtA/B/C/D-like domain-containing protein n=2 Tax=Chthoniobacter flavus TaxID=191863 RepID=B4D0T3_9BACT|nr:hypothetical protein CfE428DRAFT_2534 [Chthoniobacter flavus Ellin428]TCO91784.1 hypothetical protein EV701_10765 [Chthoniobacter flavus]